METNLNRKGRLIFATGILICVTSMILNDFHKISPTLHTVLLFAGVIVEVVGLVIVRKNGGFKKRFCRIGQK